MARYDSRPSRYEIVAQARLTTRKLTKLSVQLDIPLRTLKRIVAEPEYQKIDRQLKFGLMDDSRVKFRTEVDRSIDTVIELRDDKFVAPAVRLAAACKIIDYGIDADNTERFEERLEKVEAKTIEAVVATTSDSSVAQSGSIENNNLEFWKEQSQDWQQ